MGGGKGGMNELLGLGVCQNIKTLTLRYIEYHRYKY